MPCRSTTRREFVSLVASAPLTAGDSPSLDGLAANAFRGWFCWLAEIPCFLEPALRPAEIMDCSSLVRFAYREALRRHDGAWAARWRFPAPPPLPEVPAGIAPLFRTAAEEARHFADAEHLMRYNTRFLSRRLEAARGGDLLFFRQRQAASQPFHTMVFLERSSFEAAREPLAVYHTGPMGNSPGELRRPLLTELLRHPEPRWRPLEGNGNFLGVYRWTLLAS